MQGNLANGHPYAAVANEMLRVFCVAELHTVWPIRVLLRLGMEVRMLKFENLSFAIQSLFC